MRRKARKRLRRWIYLGASGTIGLLIIVSLFLPQFQVNPRSTGVVEPFEIIPEGIDYLGYDGSPPNYGPHWPTGADWGIYTEDIPNERQVANLAQGGILIQYNTEDGDLIEQLTQFAQNQANYPCYLIVAPYPAMESTVAVTAWGALDTLEEYDAERLQQFVDLYRGQGPENVPCTP